MGKLTDSAKMGANDSDGLSISVEIDTEAITQKMSGLLQEAFDENNLSYQDSIDLATICFHKFMEISIDEAREMALET